MTVICCICGTEIVFLEHERVVCPICRGDFGHLIEVGTIVKRLTDDRR